MTTVTEMIWRLESTLVIVDTRFLTLKCSRTFNDAPVSFSFEFLDVVSTNVPLDVVIGSFPCNKINNSVLFLLKHK